MRCRATSTPTASGTGVLLDILANDQHQVSKLVVASSMSIYGEGEYGCDEHGRSLPGCAPSRSSTRITGNPVSPLRRELEPIATRETKALYPSSVYAISKMDQELLCLSVGGGVRHRRDRGAVLQRVRATAGTDQPVHRRGRDLLGPAADRSAADGHGGRRQLRDFIHVKTSPGRRSPR